MTDSATPSGGSPPTPPRPEFVLPSESTTDVTPGPADAAPRAGRRFRWTEQLSLRTRLIGVVAVLLSLALAVAGGLTTVTLRAQLLDQIDGQLADTAKEMRYAIPGDPGKYWGPPAVIEYRSSEGAVLQHDKLGPPGADDPELPALTRSEAAELADAFTYTDDGQHWRLLVQPVTFVSTSEGQVTRQPGTLYVAMPLDDLDATVSSVLTRFALLSAALLVALMAAAYFAIGRAFRPLREVESVAVAFGEGDTSRRVDEVVPGTEVGRLGGSVNAMLDQIETTLAMREASEQRMRRFVGDASHELRTPLSTLRGFAELYRMGAVKGEENVSQTFRRIEDESTRMSHLVEDLLRLARLDEQRQLTLSSVDLLVLAADAEHDATALAPDRRVRVTGLDGAPEPGDGLVTGDEQQLRQVVTNLIANALRHTPAGTPVELGVGTRGNEVIFQVVDHGAGVPTDLAEKIFERFFRADASRSRGSGGGSGLGLSIVSAIVAAHHGTARVRPTPGGGATFEVRLPARRSFPGNSQAQPSTPPARSR